VKLMKSGSRGSDGTARSQNYGAVPKKMKVADAILRMFGGAVVSAPADEPEELPGSEEASDAESDSDASSSSSSSNKRHKKGKNKKNKGKKNKKSKKTKKHKKSHDKKKEKKEQKAAAEKAKKEEAAKAKKDEDARIRKEDAAYKAQAAKEKTTSTQAQQIVNKVSTALTSICGTLGKPGAFKLPNVATDMAKQHIKTLQQLCEGATRCLRDPSIALPVHDMKEVAKAIADAKKADVFMVQLLNTMSKLA
jgi:DNA polymerase III gamma/tau subunit